MSALDGTAAGVLAVARNLGVLLGVAADYAALRTAFGAAAAVALLAAGAAASSGRED